jgi:hypothetical protein
MKNFRKMQGKGLARDFFTFIDLFWNTRADLTDKPFIGSPKVKSSVAEGRQYQ